MSTAWIQVPCHSELSQRFDAVVHQRLVTSNWIRTVAWTVRGLLTLGMAWSVLSFHGGVNEVTTLKVGDTAPDFSATTYDGKTINLSDYVGKRGVVLFFYPKDGTAICTKEVCAFRDSYEKFIDAGVEVIGVSSDDPGSHQEFAERHQLPFPLISDTDGALRKAFGVSKTFGLFPGRATYVIDDRGIVKLIFSAQFVAEQHVTEALTALSHDIR
jgi:peroxiredoxin Q/BCP